MEPRWINPDGIWVQELEGEFDGPIPIFRRQLYNVRLDRYHPLTLVDHDGIKWQPDRVMSRINFGSIFWPVNMIPGFRPTSHKRPTAFHDCGYLYHGLYREVIPESEVFEFVPLERDEVDSICLIDAMGADGTPVVGRVYDIAVNYGGKRSWERSYDPKLRIKYGYSV